MKNRPRRSFQNKTRKILGVYFLPIFFSFPASPSASLLSFWSVSFLRLSLRLSVFPFSSSHFHLFSYIEPFPLFGKEEPQSEIIVRLELFLNDLPRALSRRQIRFDVRDDHG